MMRKFLSSFLLFLNLILAVTIELVGQNPIVTVAATEFDPNSSNTTSGHFAVVNVVQTGVQGGELTAGAPWLAQTPLVDIRKQYNYAVTSNPKNLNTTSTDYYVDVPNDYVFAVTPGTKSDQLILQYSVTDMVPNSAVSVTIKYQNIISPTSTKLATCTNPASLKAGINPATGQYGNEVTPQLKPGEKNEKTIPGTVDAKGNVVLLLSQVYSNPCGDLAISSIEIKGQIKPAVISRAGSTVCKGEQIILEPKFPYKGKYQWFKDGVAVPGATSSSYAATADAIKNYTFKLQVTLDGTSQPIFSDDVVVASEKCCDGPNGSAASRQLIYLDDFGRVDLSDPSGNTWWVWDYTTNPRNPKEKKVMADNPFRRRDPDLDDNPLFQPPFGQGYAGTGAFSDGLYTIAAYLTSNNPYKGIDGALLSWANAIGGVAHNDIAYDHSGKVDGGALLINLPLKSEDAVVYSRSFTNLCTTPPNTVYFECYINQFTPGNPVDVEFILTSGSKVAKDQQTTLGKSGNWVKISGSLELETNSIDLKIYNRAPNASNGNGNDLVMDDIRILACAPPPIDLVFNKEKLTIDTLICKDRKFVSLPTDNLKAYYGSDIAYLYQWSQTPADPASWQKFSGPTLGSAGGETTLLADPSTLTALDPNEKIYFRVVVGHNSTVSGVGPFNQLDPCRDYSVSDAILGTYQCPACSKPSKITVTNGTTPVADGGTVTICEGSALDLKIAAEWPLVNASLPDKNVDLYRKISTSKDSVLKTFVGSALDKGEVTFSVAATNVKPSLAGTYTFGAKNTNNCRLESSVKLVVNKKILNNAIEDNDTICVKGTPMGFESSKTISGDYTGFKWQSGASATGTFTDIASTNSETYKPTAPNINTAGTYYYRRVALAKKDGAIAVCADSVSKTVALVVQPAITANTITLAANPVCSGREASFTGSAVAGGAYGWLQGTSNTGPWTVVTNANQQDLKVTVNKAVSATFYFRRIVKLGKCADTTAPTKVDVIDGMNPGSVDKSQTICLGSNVAPLTSLSAASGGTGTGVTYLWQSASSTSGPWADVSGQTNTTYAPATPTAAGVTYYRRRATNGTSSCDTAYSNTLKVTVAAPPVAEITKPVAVISSTPPATGSTTTRNPSIFIEAQNPGAAYLGEWKITNGRGAGLKGGNLKALSDSLLLLGFGQSTTAVWSVQDTAKACTPVTATVIVTRKNFTLPDAGPDDTICFTNVGAYKLNGNAFTAGDERGYWEVVNPVTGLSITQPNVSDSTEASIGVPGPGVYEFRYRIVNPVLGENNTDIVRITVDADVAQPTLPRPDTSICVTELRLDANLDGQPATAVGTWKPATGEVFSTQVIETPNDSKSMLTDIPTSTGTTVTKLTWEVKNGVCPAKSVNFTVNQVGLLSNPTISLNGTRIRGTDTTLCDGVAYTLTTNTILSGESGAWTTVPGGASVSIPGGSATSQAVTINKEGNTDVTWTMSKTSCPDAPITVTLKVYKKPTLQPLVGSPICEDQNGTYYAKSVIPATNDTLPITAYNWYSTPNTPVGSKGVATLQGANSTATGEFKFTSTAMTGATDQATVSVTATNACGISIPQDLEVTINLKPRDFAGPISGDLEICQSSKKTRPYDIPQQAANVTSVNWYLNGSPWPALGTLSSPMTEIDFANWKSDITPKIVKAQLVGDCGIGVADSIEIKIIPAEPVKAVLSGSDKVCLPRDAFIYTGASSNGGTNKTYYFEIIHKDGTPGKTQGPDLSNTFVTVVGDLKNESKIRLEVIGDSLTGCFTTGSGKDSIIIDGYEYPDTNVFRPTPDTVCFGNKVTFAISNTMEGNTLYTWYKDNNPVPVKSSPESFIDLYNRAESGLYKVKIDNLVCDSRTSGEHRARIFDQPIVKFIPDEVLMEISVMPNYVLNPEITGLTSDTLTQINWSPTDLLTIPSPLSTTATFTPPPLGGQFTYTIRVATGESKPCPAEASIKIFALPPVKVPNAFSPNNDGLNELWQIDGIEAYPRARVIVYNRWGNKMFESQPYNGSNGWDGTAHGTKLPMGTYYYVIDLNENTVVQSRYLTGSLTIVH